MYYDLHSYEVADETNLFGFCIKKKYSFRVIVQVALHPAKINISLFTFSQAFLKVRCGVSNVIAN